MRLFPSFVRLDLAPRFYPILSSLRRFLVAAFGAVADGLRCEAISAAQHRMKSRVDGLSEFGRWLTDRGLSAGETRRFIHLDAASLLSWRNGKARRDCGNDGGWRDSGRKSVRNYSSVNKSPKAIDLTNVPSAI